MGAVWLGHGGLFIGYKVVIVSESCETTVASFPPSAFSPLSLGHVRALGSGDWGQWAARHAACITHDDRTPQRTPDSVRPRLTASGPDSRVCHGSSFIPEDLCPRACSPSGLRQHRPLRQPPPQRWPAASAQADASSTPAKQTYQQDSEWQFQQGFKRQVCCWKPRSIVSNVSSRDDPT